MKLLAFMLLSTGGVLAYSFQPAHSPRDGDKFTVSGNASRGRRVFVQRSCVDCHAVMGSGGDLGPDLADGGRVRSFHRFSAKLWDHLPLLNNLQGVEVQDWPELSSQEMEDLVAYLFQLNYFEEPGDFARGKKAFGDKGCGSCHSIGGVGTATGPGPALDTFATNASPLGMVSAMWSHGPKMLLSQRAKGIETPTFQGAEVADIMAYLKGATLEPSQRTALMNPGDPENGFHVFKAKQCVICHPVGGLKSTAEAPDLALAKSSYTVSAYAGILWNHAPMVWDRLQGEGLAIPPFSAGEMTDLLGYLYALQFHRPGGDRRRGQQLFESRGCTTCHETGSTEDYDDLPPGLADFSPIDPVELIAALWNHGSLTAPEGEPWPRFDEGEARDLAWFMRSTPEEEEPADIDK